MKRKKNFLPLILFVLLTAAVFFCRFRGSVLRGMFAESAEYLLPTVTERDGVLCCALPRAVLSSEDETAAAVFAAVPSEEYPEDAYIAARVSFTCFDRDAETVYVRFGQLDPSLRVLCGGDYAEGQYIRITPQDERSIP